MIYIKQQRMELENTCIPLELMFCKFPIWRWTKYSNSIQLLFNKNLWIWIHELDYSWQVLRYRDHRLRAVSFTDCMSISLLLKDIQNNTYRPHIIAGVCMYVSEVGTQQWMTIKGSIQWIPNGTPFFKYRLSVKQLVIIYLVVLM